MSFLSRPSARPIRCYRIAVPKFRFFPTKRALAIQCERKANNRESAADLMDRLIPTNLQGKVHVTNKVTIDFDNWVRHREGRNYAVLPGVEVNPEGGQEALKAALCHAYHNLLPSKLVDDKGETLASKEQVKAFHVDFGFNDTSIAVFCAF